MKKLLPLSLFLIFLPIQAKAVKLDRVNVPVNVLMCKEKTKQNSGIIYYVELKTNANIRSAPVLLHETVVKRAKKGDIFPVYEILSSRYGIFFKIGKNLYVHYSVARIVEWL